LIDIAYRLFEDFHLTYNLDGASFARSTRS